MQSNLVNMLGYIIEGNSRLKKYFRDIYLPAQATHACQQCLSGLRKEINLDHWEE